MTQHAPIIPNSASLIRHDGWTRERQAAFLRELAASHCVSTAARVVGMSRQSAYALRARMKGKAFDRAWAAALLCRFDALAEAAMERALTGVEVPHFYKGELVGTSRKYDERLTVALLAMRASFIPQARHPGDPAAFYRPDDFAALVERVACGPATWDDERRLAYLDGLDDEDEPEDPDDDPAGDDPDDDDPDGCNPDACDAG